MKPTRNTPNSLPPASRILHPHSGFTLVELLVVITIIGILVALITVAAAGALKRARQAEIKVEVDQIGMAFETYKDTNGSYPPNCQVDDVNETGVENPNEPIVESQVLTDLRRHFKQAFPRSREPDNLLRTLVGLNPTGTTAGNFRVLRGGMTAGEAIVFWLGGFSADPKYPISGDGGPSYDVTGVAVAERRERDTLQRNWAMPLEQARLAPRAEDEFFDETIGTDGRFIEYTITISGVQQTRRINFWQYAPKKSQQPYLYFDTSRHLPEPRFDPPAATLLTGLGSEGLGLHVHAIKKAAASAGAPLVIEFANPEKFQILHAGVDDEWGEEAFERMSFHGLLEDPDSLGLDPNRAADYYLFPTGPFSGEVADTIVNFSTETLEKSQP
jgi:prepilin-type N-terminal cleavage/methylation domain-containing protein